MTRDWTTTARTLSEALPYMQRYNGATVVIKLGGHAMGSHEGMQSFARDVVLMRQVGMNPVVVHGGGPMINQLLDKLGIISNFVDGKRVTDAATMEVVEMVLSGQVNNRLVQAISDQGGKAVGLSGKDANLIHCKPTDPALGLVGTPTQIDTTILRDLSDAKAIPVIAPLGMGANGETYNMNGDTAAGAIAGALRADRLLLLTDVPGVLDKEKNILTEIDVGQVPDLIADGTISGGMIPKIETATDAIHKGVRGVVILDGRVPNAVLLELFTTYGAGSLIRTPR